jgi:hypothetical protein
MFASLDPSVKIRVLTEHLKGDFKLALRKLQQQRGGIELRCSTQFHDRLLMKNPVEGIRLPAERRGKRKTKPHVTPE